MTRARFDFDLAAVGAGLVVSTAEHELRCALEHGAMVVTAAPGTGKTTFIPPMVANEVPGRVVVTQPRQVAVRAAARRLAHLAGTTVGDAVGFSVRGESRQGSATRVEFVTPGVLMRRLLDDASLDGVCAVIVDEVHERSVDGDLLLGMLAEIRQLREDLVLVAMSATLDAEAVASVLGGDRSAPVVDVPSALHPLTIEYAPARTPRTDVRGVTAEFRRHIARAAVQAQARDAADTLVFVPTARDVDDVAAAIRALAPALEVLPLHGQLSPAQQDRATAGRRDPDDPPRVVVSTALAESSLTVPGVRVVVDAGLAREPRRDTGRGVTGLVTVSASRASADQRAGRAAREAPGRAVRLYSEADLARMPADVTPAIRAADLTDAALALACWGTPGAIGLRLLTAPPAASMAAAADALAALGLIDDDGQATELGRRVARMPAGARDGRALLSATTAGIDGPTAAEVVAALAGGYRERGADLGRLLSDLRSGRAPGSDRWRADARRLARLVATSAAAPVASTSDAAGIVCALARPDWIARRVPSAARTYLLASGTRAALPETSALADVEWLAIWDAQRSDGRAGAGTGTVIRLAAPLTEADALRIGAPLVVSERVARIDDGRVQVREQRRLGAIVLSDTPVAATAADTVPALASHLRSVGIGALVWTPAATRLRARMALLHRALGPPWPDVSDDALLDGVDGWLASAVDASPTLADVDTAAVLRGMLPWPQARQLDELVPERLRLPSGVTAPIEYPTPGDPDGQPVLAVKIQDAFGLNDSPWVVDGRVPVLVHLLSPARRPLAVTSDLAGFWTGAYAEVRKQMRGRYPKHSWPEAP